jgi:hypothetical protein
MARRWRVATGGVGTVNKDGRPDFIVGEGTWQALLRL